MSNDREQKIRDVYEAMCASRVKDGWSAVVPGGVAAQAMMRNARAAVDLLDPPPARTELSDGFFTVPLTGSSAPNLICKQVGGLARKNHGMLSDEAVTAWAAAGAPCVTTTKTEAELRGKIGELKERNAQLTTIILTISPEKLMAQR